MKNQSVFRCPDTPNDTAISYMLNDRAAGEALATFAALANTILMSESSPVREADMRVIARDPGAAPALGRLAYNVGHALAPSRPVAAAGVYLRKVITPVAGTPRGQAVVDYIPAARAWDAAARADVYRHEGFGNFAHLDGHVRGFRSGQVFFPERGSTGDCAHRPGRPPLGPNPSGDMTFKGSRYASTFHIR